MLQFRQLKKRWRLPIGRSVVVNKLSSQNPRPLQTPTRGEVNFKMIIQSLAKQFSEQRVVGDRTTGDNQSFGIRLFKSSLDGRNQERKLDRSFFDDIQRQNIFALSSLSDNGTKAGNFTFGSLGGIEEGDRLVEIGKIEEGKQLLAHRGVKITSFHRTQRAADSLAGDPPARTFISEGRAHSSGADLQSVFISPKGNRAGTADQTQTNPPRVIECQEKMDIGKKQKGNSFTENGTQSRSPAKLFFLSGKTGVTETKAQDRSTVRLQSNFFDQGSDGLNRNLKANNICVTRSSHN